MSDEAQLRWEAENGKRFAVAAFISGLLTIASFVSQVLTFQGVKGDVEVLRQIDAHQAGVLAGRLIQAVAVITLIVALYYLFKATVARRPEGGLNFFWPVGILAAVLLAVAGISGYFDATAAAGDFVSGNQSAANAKKFADDLTTTVTQALGQAGGLCLGLTYVLISLNAMRAGLLSRFMGVLGMIGGALVVLPLLPGGVVQLFWIVALGALFLNRWPNGRGPAWDVVEAVPWPTAADVQAAKVAVAERESGEGDAVPEAGGDEPTPGDPRRSRQSRKKKRRGGH